MDESGHYLAFSEAIARPDQEIDLARVSLLIAAQEYPGLDSARYLAQLDTLAENAKDYAAQADEPYRLLACINYVLFSAEGFKGNQDDYYDPRNSFLNCVLERKMGIPITLSVVYMEVARRVGLEVKGVGFPGHFLVTTQCDEQPLFIDSFNGGRIVTQKDLQALLDRIYGGRLKVRSDFLVPISRRQIIERMLNNMKSIYYSDGRDLHKCLRVIEHLLILNPADPDQLRDRGLLKLRLDDRSGALQDLEEFLRLAPDGGGANVIRERVSELRKQSRTLH